MWVEVRRGPYALERQLDTGELMTRSGKTTSKANQARWGCGKLGRPITSMFHLHLCLLASSQVCNFTSWYLGEEMEVGKIGKTDRHHMFIPPAPPICNLCAPIYGNYVKDLQQRSPPLWGRYITWNCKFYNKSVQTISTMLFMDYKKGRNKS